LADSRTETGGRSYGEGMMYINLTIDDYELKKIFHTTLENKIIESIEPRIAQLLKDQINTEEVVKMLIERIRNSMCGLDTSQATSTVALILDEKLKELVKNIKDEELKDMLLERLIVKMG
jgi:hypothetical protein